MIGVVKIGSALFTGSGKKKLASLKNFIKSFKGDLVFVAGGGPSTKTALDIYRDFGFSEGFLDQIGIEMTHINARALARILKGVYCKKFEDVEKEVGNLPITGGQVPGQSTDAVAAGLADYLGAEILILVKDVGGIYSKDPKENPGARIIHSINLDDLETLVEKNPKAGRYGVLDRQAFRIIKRTGVRTYVVGPDFDFEEGTEIKQ